jgi:competence protein ComEC
LFVVCIFAVGFAFSQLRLFYVSSPRHTIAMNDIRRKLDLIDKQLAGGPSFFERIISTSPLAIVALGLIAGIVIQNVAVLPIWFWLTLLGLCATAAILIFTVYKEGKIASYPAAARACAETSAPILLSACALMCFLCLGAIRLTAFYRAKPNDIRNFVGNRKELATGDTKNTEKRLKMDSRFRGNDRDNGVNDRDKNDNDNSADSANSAVRESDAKLATIRGIISTEPYIQNYSEWKFARFKLTDPTSSFYLKLREIETAGGWVEASGTIRVQVDEPILDLKAGDYVQMYCWLDRFNGPTNPGQFDVAKYLARRNVFVAASVQSRDAIELLKGNSAGASSFIKLKRRLQEIAGQALRGDLDVEGQNYALLQALVLGYRTEIDSETYEAFQKTGLLHFLCLSGMNFMILFWIIWWLCKTAGLMKRACAVICLAAAGIFLLVIPPQPPAFRAAIMCSVFCASFFFRRNSNPFNALSLAAVILLLIRPNYLFEADWQLSFASVLGILLFAEPIENFINEKVTALLEDPATGKPRPYSNIVSRLTSPVIAVFSVSSAAWLASTGILLHHFYRINYLTSVWTVIVSPLIAVASIGGYVKVFLALVLPSAGIILDKIISPVLGLLIWLVKLFAGRNISEILIGKMSPVVVILYYAFLLFAFFVHFRRPFVKKLVWIAAALVIIVSLVAVKWQRTYRDELVLTCLDVGHGQAILAQLPGKANILFDAGSLQKSDVGRRVVIPFLDYSGINRIDAIIISHNDVDHINGIPEIVEHCKVSQVFANEAFFDETDRWGTAKFLKDYLATKDLEIKHMDTSLSFGSPANIKTLWPINDVPKEQLSDNDKSSVSLIQFGIAKVLLCSDIEKYAQAQLLATIPDLKADIVIVPHHGSRRTLDVNFLEGLESEILICSCDRTQYQRYVTVGNKDNPNSFYTARDGAIKVSINKDETITATTFLNKP